MPNPWTKKNPFLSMWLSAANAAAGAARGRAASRSRQATRQAMAAATSGYLDMLRALGTPPPAKARRRKRR